MPPNLPIEEAVPLDDHPPHPGDGHCRPVGVGDGNRELQPAGVDVDQRRMGGDRFAGPAGLHMVDLDPGADARRSIGQLPGDGGHSRFLAQGHQPGGGQHGDVTGSECDRGVGLGDGQRDLGRQPGLRAVLLVDSSATLHCYPITHLPAGTLNAGQLPG